MFVVLAVVVLLWIMSLRVVVPTNMVSSTGGVNMAGMIEGLSQTETGKALVNSFISRLGGKTE